MKSRDQDLRQKIIEAAKDLLNEGIDIGTITVRQIAERAGVGIGLINYHFKSKDNLLSIAIGDIMEQTIVKYIDDKTISHIEPDVRLKMLLKELCSSAGTDEKLVRFMLLREITEGDMRAPLYLVPILREMLGERMNDVQLRIIALQILQPIQLSGLNPAAFHLYSGIDITNADQRDIFIDTLIDNLITTTHNGVVSTGI